jgi:acyl transferase domain-containing protein
MEAGSAARVYAATPQEGQLHNRAALEKFGEYCIQQCRNIADAPTYQEYLSTIAELFVQGQFLDFQGLFPKGSRRIALPTYPFSGGGHWQRLRRAVGLTSAPRKERAQCARPLKNTLQGDSGVRVDQVLESVMWQKGCPHDAYEKVTF